MHRVTIVLVASLVASACAYSPPAYVVRYDLEQLASETSMRDASPGFGSLPRSTGRASGMMPPA